MAQIGYVPSGNAPGFGEMLPGRARITEIGRFLKATWIRRVRLRVGRNTATNAQVRALLYTGDTQPADLLHATILKAVTVRMVDNTGGRTLDWAVTGVGVAANTRLFGGPHALGSSIAYSQDLSGTRMYFDDTASSVPDPWPITGQGHYNQPEGRISIEVEGQDNRRPNLPQIIAPIDNGVTIDTTPEIIVGFSDPDDELGDVFSAYRIEIWQGNTLIDTSDRVETNETGQNARRATWVPGTLLAGTYRLRTIVYDAFNVPSQTRETTFSVNAGGALSEARLPANAIAGRLPTGGIVASTAAPSAVVRWSHEDGLATEQIEIRARTLVNVILEQLGDAIQASYVRDQTVAEIVEQLGGPTSPDHTADVIAAVMAALGSPQVEEYRPTYVIEQTIASGAEGTIGFPVLWSPLTADGTPLVLELRATDTQGGTSPWTRTPAFQVNDVPDLHGLGPADESRWTELPALTAIVADGNDSDGAHTVAFTLYPAGGGAVGVPARHLGGGLYQAQLTAQDVPSYQSLDWQATATDPWGASSSSPIRTLHYVLGPQISDLTPTGTITTGTPTISATVDRTIDAWRVWVRARNGQRVYVDSLERDGSGSSIAFPVPIETLANATDYDLELWVRATDGLTARQTVQFRVQYDPPWYMSGCEIRAVESSIFDRGGGDLPPQKPNLELSWHRVDESIVPEGDFLGVTIYKEAPDGTMTGRTILDRNQTRWVDTTPEDGVEYRFHIGYVRRINGLDVIESRLTTLRGSVDIKHSVITSDSPDDPAVTLHYWDSRPVHHEGARGVVPIMGASKPEGYRGQLSYQVLSIEARLWDAADRSFTALDQRDAILALDAPDRDENDEPCARSLTWRDPKKRAMPIMITNVDEDDQHRSNRHVMPFEVTEIRRDEPLVSTDTSTAIDMTGAIEPTLLLPLDGSLEGRDRRGMTTASGGGALRWVPGFGGAPTTTNWVRNPLITTPGGSGGGYTWEWVAEPLQHPDGVTLPGYVRFVASAGASYNVVNRGVHHTAPIEFGVPYVSQMLMRVTPSAAPGNRRAEVGLYEVGSTLGNTFVNLADEPITGDWQLVTASGRVNRPDSTSMAIYGRLQGVQAGDVIEVAAFQVEIGTERTPFFFGGAYDSTYWTGVANDSPSYREAWALGGALMVEEGASNYAMNPLPHPSGTDYWAPLESVEREIVEDAVSPTGWAQIWRSLGTASSQFVGSIPSVNGLSLPSGTFTFSVYTWTYDPDAFARVRMGVYLRYTDGTSSPQHFSQDLFFNDVSSSTTPRRLIAHITAESGKQVQTFTIYPYVLGKNGEAIPLGAEVRFAGAQIEENRYPTSLIPQIDRNGTLLPGYSWGGTGHNSQSTRLIAHLAFNPITNGRVSLDQGTIALRARFSDILASGRDQIVFSHYIDGQNRLYLGRRGNGTGMVAIGALHPAILGGTVPPDEWIDLAMQYDGQRVWLRVNDETFGPVPYSGLNMLGGIANIGRSDSANAPSAAVGGVVVTRDLLSDDEWARLRALDTWSWNGIQADTED